MCRLTDPRRERTTPANASDGTVRTLRLLSEGATRGSWSGSGPKAASTISGGNASALRSGRQGRRESEFSKRSMSGSRRRRFLRMRSFRSGSLQRVGASKRSPDRGAPPIGHAAHFFAPAKEPTRQLRNGHGWMFFFGIFLPIFWIGAVMRPTPAGPRRTVERGSNR